MHSLLTATVALWLRRPPREREVVGSIPGRVLPKTKIGILVAAPPGVWHYGVSARTGRPGVSIYTVTG